MSVFPSAFAFVFGYNAAVAGIAHGHAPAAFAAYYEPLQQCGSFARRAADFKIRLVGTQLLDVCVVSFSRDVSWMVIRYAHRPLIFGQTRDMVDENAVGRNRLAVMIAAVYVHPRITRVVKYA